MRKLSRQAKQNLKGGSFYTIALGIGTLLSTITSVAGTFMEISKMANGNSYQRSGYAARRAKAYMRLSPMPSRSAFSIYL